MSNQYHIGYLTEYFPSHCFPVREGVYRESGGDFPVYFKNGNWYTILESEVMEGKFDLKKCWILKCAISWRGLNFNPEA